MINIKTFKHFGCFYNEAKVRMLAADNEIQCCSWREIKHQVKEINKALYEVIESVDPEVPLPFYLVRYKYGQHFGVKNKAYLPLANGTTKKIEEFDIDSEVYKELGYGKDSLPLGVILDKFCEWHYFNDEGQIFPDCVQGPGAIFNMQIIFDEDKTIDNNVLSVSAGTLSSFLLPNIGSKRNHQRLIKHFKVSSPAPKTPYEHHTVFTEILKNSKDDWKCQILYFSKSFIEQIQKNDKWLKLKLFFSEALRKKLTQNTYDASCYDLFLTAQRVNRHRPTPFIIDTAKYIFNICMGAGLGVKPATDENYIPIKAIQDAYQHCYGLEYTPTVMVPSTLTAKNEAVYYPLQCPFSKINTFKTNISNSTLTELETLRKVVLSYQEEFISEHGEAYGSPLYHISKETSFDFYHYQAKDQEGINGTQNVNDIDHRFNFSHWPPLKFANEAKLFRGCVKITPQ